jgi:hypothetical protein
MAFRIGRQCDCNAKAVAERKAADLWRRASKSGETVGGRSLVTCEIGSILREGSNFHATSKVRAY